MARYCDTHDTRMRFEDGSWSCPDCEARAQYANIAWDEVNK